MQAQRGDAAIAKSLRRWPRGAAVGFRSGVSQLGRVPDDGRGTGRFEPAFERLRVGIHREEHPDAHRSEGRVGDRDRHLARPRRAEKADRGAGFTPLGSGSRPARRSPIGARPSESRRAAPDGTGHRDAGRGASGSPRAAASSGWGTPVSLEGSGVDDLRVRSERRGWVHEPLPDGSHCESTQLTYQPADSWLSPSGGIMQGTTVAEARSELRSFVRCCEIFTSPSKSAALAPERP